MTRPPSRSNTRSASLTSDGRWVTSTRVRLPLARSSHARRKLSPALSTAVLASSNSTMRGLLTRARAMKRAPTQPVTHDRPKGFQEQRPQHAQQQQYHGPDGFVGQDAVVDLQQRHGHDQAENVQEQQRHHQIKRVRSQRGQRTEPEGRPFSTNRRSVLGTSQSYSPVLWFRQNESFYITYH